MLSIRLVVTSGWPQLAQPEQASAVVDAAEHEAWQQCRLLCNLSDTMTTADGSMRTGAEDAANACGGLEDARLISNAQVAVAMHR